MCRRLLEGFDLAPRCLEVGVVLGVGGTQSGELRLGALELREVRGEIGPRGCPIGLQHAKFILRGRVVALHLPQVRLDALHGGQPQRDVLRQGIPVLLLVGGDARLDRIEFLAQFLGFLREVGGLRRPLRTHLGVLVQGESPGRWRPPGQFRRVGARRKH